MSSTFYHYNLYLSFFSIISQSRYLLIIDGGGYCNTANKPQNLPLFWTLRLLFYKCQYVVSQMSSLIAVAPLKRTSLAILNAGMMGV